MENTSILSYIVNIKVKYPVLGNLIYQSSIDVIGFRNQNRLTGAVIGARNSTDFFARS